MVRSRGVATTLAHLALVPLFALVACAQPPAAAPAPPAPAASGAAAPAAPAASAPAGQPAPQAAPAPLNPPLTVKVGTLTLVGEAGIFDAIAKGYFREEGIEVDL